MLHQNEIFVVKAAEFCSRIHRWFQISSLFTDGALLFYFAVCVVPFEQLSTLNEASANTANMFAVLC